MYPNLALIYFVMPSLNEMCLLNLDSQLEIYLLNSVVHILYTAVKGICPDTLNPMLASTFKSH